MIDKTLENYSHCKRLDYKHFSESLQETGFPRGRESFSGLKNPRAHARDGCQIPGLGRSSGGGNGNALQYSCLGNPTQRSLAGYSPWGHKESNKTQQLNNENNCRKDQADRALVDLGQKYLMLPNYMNMGKDWKNRRRDMLTGEMLGMEQSIPVAISRETRVSEIQHFTWVSVK